MNTTLYGDIKKLAQKWKQYPNEYNPDDPLNRQILIEKNLKMAVGVALKYRGMGLSEDELISAATLGLCAAYEKYNPDKVVLRNKLLAAVTDATTPEEFTELVANLMPYGGKVAEMFANQKPQTPEEMRQWVHNNIKPAKFSSVAYMWIKAYVLSDLDKYAKPVRVSEKDRGDVFFDSIDEGELYFCKQIKTGDPQRPPVFFLCNCQNKVGGQCLPETFRRQRYKLFKKPKLVNHWEHFVAKTPKHG